MAVKQMLTYASTNLLNIACFTFSIKKTKQNKQ